jgi:hypothetical protein
MKTVRSVVVCERISLLTLNPLYAVKHKIMAAGCGD